MDKLDKPGWFLYLLYNPCWNGCFMRFCGQKRYLANRTSLLMSFILSCLASIRPSTIIFNLQSSITLQSGYMFINVHHYLLTSSKFGHLNMIPLCRKFVVLDQIRPSPSNFSSNHPRMQLKLSQIDASFIEFYLLQPQMGVFLK